MSYSFPRISRCLDPFLGSGTTTLAAMQAGRNSIGVEVEQEYLDLCRKRVANLPLNVSVISEWFPNG